MSTLTRELVASAARSHRHLITGSVEQPVRSTWAQVHQQALRMAAGLAAQRIGPHSSVAVLAADAADVAPLAQAIWFRRATLTMLQHPTPRTDLQVWLADTARAATMIGADTVIVGAPFLGAMDQLDADGFTVCTIESLCGGEPFALTAADHALEADIALRQLTSGSTGVPKAVEITHANLAANAIAMIDALDIDTDIDVAVSWLPLSHDMGFIGFLCLPMQIGAECVVVRPEQFLRRPMSWAELIGRHRATITSGPNFAYSVLGRMLAGADATAIDLSSLRVAINGAEPIDHRNIAEFVSAGAGFGLSAAAPTPAYGLAEATLAVSFGTHNGQPLVDRVCARSITDLHRAVPAGADERDVAHIVSVGWPVRGMEVRIVRDAMSLAPREIGTIELRGPAVTSRYLTAEGEVPITSDDGWLDTGDLGYLDEDGRIYVCGRSKDLIVVAGRNLYPHDIERAAEHVDGVRKGCVVAVRVDAEQEGFAVLAEVRDSRDTTAQVQIRREVVNRVLAHVGHAPREVRLLPPGTLPKTASGKLRRDNARQLLTSG
jgi:fatty-acyl-CoA synthase